MTTYRERRERRMYRAALDIGTREAERAIEAAKAKTASAATACATTGEAPAEPERTEAHWIAMFKACPTPVELEKAGAAALEALGLQKLEGSGELGSAFTARAAKLRQKVIAGANRQAVRHLCAVPAADQSRDRTGPVEPAGALRVGAPVGIGIARVSAWERPADPGPCLARHRGGDVPAMEAAMSEGSHDNPHAALVHQVDALLAQVRAAEEQARLGWDRAAEKDRAYEQAIAQVAAGVVVLRRARLALVSEGWDADTACSERDEPGPARPLLPAIDALLADIPAAGLALSNELAEWRSVFGHLGATPDECGNALNAKQTEVEAERVYLFAGAWRSREELAELDQARDDNGRLVQGANDRDRESRQLLHVTREERDAAIAQAEGEHRYVLALRADIESLRARLAAAEKERDEARYGMSAQRVAELENRLAAAEAQWKEADALFLFHVNGGCHAERDKLRSALTESEVARQQMRDALEACKRYIPGSEVHSWPPGFRLKEMALKLTEAALGEKGAKP